MPGSFLNTGSTMAIFAERQDKQQIEEGSDFAPKFDADGLIPCITTDADTGAILMFAFMNNEALARTIQTGEVHYYSRSRQKLWKKGESSGLTQRVVQMLIDCDQDCIQLRVKVANVHGAGSCHVGYRTCFYREVPVGELPEGGPVKLRFVETEKVFDPSQVYGNA